ncbi:MAG: hypothetical protein K0S51_121 [Bacillales bacterium]|jgi:uncharacterized RDD family membrane protein YckC|nr:hypothetical protein [Bacillales bacterium]
MENNNLETIVIYNTEEDSQKQLKTNDVKIGFWIRFWAYSFDFIIAALLTSIIKPIIFYFLNLEEGTLIESFIKSLIFFSYFVLLTKLQSQTLGKMLFGIKVVKENGNTLDWNTVLFRELIGRYISIKVFFIGYIYTAFDHKKRAWHDIIADTSIIHVEYKKIV